MFACTDEPDKSVSLSLFEWPETKVEEVALLFSLDTIPETLS